MEIVPSKKQKIPFAIFLVTTPERLMLFATALTAAIQANKVCHAERGIRLQDEKGQKSKIAKQTGNPKGPVTRTRTHRDADRLRRANSEDIVVGNECSGMKRF